MDNMSLALKYQLSFINSLGQRKFFVSVIRFIEMLRLLYRVNSSKRLNETAVLRYIQNSVKKGSTVINIGEGDLFYQYFIVRKLKGTGKLITLESSAYVNHHFLLLKEIFNWQNVVVDAITNCSNMVDGIRYVQVVHPVANTKAGFTFPGLQGALDHYCSKNAILPGFIKIDMQRNECSMLYEGISTLMKCRPRILLTCEARLAGKENIIQIFQFLTGIGYTGHFFLDTIRLPLINFDFDTYQNPFKNFYCNHFVFE